MGAHCVKLDVPLCGGVAASEHKEDAGACHLELRRGARPAASVALAAASESSANATLSFALAGEHGLGRFDVR